ncbi:tetratricopeptide repeat protein [Sphingobium xenophagum]|uniref:tetratricopeptide repeat protein n=1 Tax=Sphingobium xenophagum TaxID=121428 RepID=UPI00037D09D6|nr:SEL1-like repeat protein [Sphingobium xenophagum]
MRKVLRLLFAIAFATVAVAALQVDARLPLGLMLWAGAASFGLAALMIALPAFDRLRSRRLRAAGWLMCGALLGVSLSHLWMSAEAAQGARAGSSPEEEVNRMLRWSAVAGNAEDMYNLGIRLSAGDAKAQQEAERWLRAAGGRGYADSITPLARLLVAQARHSEAQGLLEGATAPHNAENKWLLSQVIWAQSPNRSAENLWQPLLREAANEGQVDAMALVGVLLAQGEQGFTKDPVEARQWYRKAALKGHARAAFNLGLDYEWGMGGLPDREQAIAAYRMAVVHDLPEAKLNLGVMLMNRGDDVSLREAKSLFLDVAQGDRVDLAAIAEENIEVIENKIQL